MEANGLSKSNLPFVAIACGTFGCTSTTPPNSDVIMSDVATALAPSTPDRSTVLRVVQTSIDNYAPVAITPTCSRDNSDHNYQESSYESKDESSASILKGVRDNVALVQARVSDIESRISRQHQQELMTMLKNQLFTEQLCLIDTLAIMAWEHYRISVEESSSHEKAEASVKHIFEEALDISIRLFCSDPQSSSPLASMNLDRLMILLMVLDFDEYCETLLHYQIARKYVTSEDIDVATRQSLEGVLRPTGEKYLQQLHELWKGGVFDRFDLTASEEEEGFAKLHATGLCLVLFRQLESRVGHQNTDLTVLQKQFKVIFDDYLPKELTQRPSMNNIVATKHSRLLFTDDGRPTVYWSLLADSYRKEWADYFDQDDDHISDMETDDEDDDDGL